MKIGRAIAAGSKKSDIICLFGNLGSGKTVLTRGIASGLGVKKDNIISPTFVLIRQYKGKLPVYHFDLYRLQGTQDILALGYEEYFYNEGISIIEWADRLCCLMPKEFLRVDLEVTGENKRSLEFSAFGSRSAEWLKDIRSRLTK